MAEGRDPRAYPEGRLPYPWGERTISFREYWLIIYKHRGIVLAATLSLLFFTGIWSFSQKPVYFSRTIIEVRPERLDLVERVYQPMIWYSAMTLVNTQMKVAQSRAVAEEVAERLGPDHVARLLGLSSRDTDSSWTAEQVAGALLGRLRVKAIEDTFMFELGVEANQPETAAELANAWAESLIRFNRETEIELGRVTSEALQKQAEQLRKAISEKEARLSQMAESAQIQVLDQQLNVGYQKLDQLSQQLLDVQKELVEKESKVRRIRLTPPDSLAEIMSSPLVQSLRRECDQAEQEYEEKSKIYQENFPGLQQIRAKRDQVCGRLQREIRGLHRKLLQQAQADLTATREKEREIQKKFDETREQIEKLNKMTTEYRTLKADLENDRRLLEKMLQRRQAAQLSEVGGIHINTLMRIVEPAIASSSPIRPRRTRAMVMALAVGLLMGIGLALVLNFLDDKVHTHEDIERLTPYRFLAFIPDIEKEREHKVVLNALRFLSEYLGLLRTSKNPPRVLLITSPQPGEGKTFIASNLAIAQSLKARPVLIIDLDVHRPRLHRAFHVPRQPGLVDLLMQVEAPQFDVFRKFNPYLTVVPTGRAEAHQVSLLLEEDRFRALMDGALKRFEYIILDSGPLLVVPETLRVAQWVDDTVIVVRSDFTTYGALKLAVDQLQKTDTRVLGVVLNKVDLTSRYSYYNYHYRYRSYYLDESRAARRRA